MDDALWAGDRERAGVLAGTADIGCGEGAAAIGSGGIDSARQLYGASDENPRASKPGLDGAPAGCTERVGRRGVVRAAVAGAHSSPHGGDAAQAGGASHGGRVHAVAAALAACCAADAPQRRARTAATVAAVAGRRDSGERVGETGPGAAHE